MLIKLQRKVFIVIKPIVNYYLRFFKRCELGSNVLFLGMPVINGNVFIRSGVLISLRDGNVLGINGPVRLSTSPHAGIYIGDRFQASGVVMYASKGIFIGDNVMMGPGVTIIDSNMHPIDPVSRAASATDIKSKEIVIGDNVWLGKGVTVLKGVTIGENTIIGAGIVIRKSLPANSIVSHSDSTIDVTRLQSGK
jgi:serine acetyltransferase